MVAPLEERMARVEGILEEVRNRLNHVESALRDLRRELRSAALWIIGLMLGLIIPMWTSVMLAIVLSE